MKACNKCGLIKELDMFFKNSGAKDGRHSICKVCRSADQTKYYEENKKKFVIRRANYYERNKEKIILSTAKYREENKEKRALNKARYRKENKEKMALSAASYREKNKEKLILSAAKYREKNKKKVTERDLKYQKNAVSTLNDSYAKRLLKLKGIDIPQELIKLKRIQLLIKRELRK